MRYLDVFDGVKVVARVLDLGNERATPARVPEPAAGSEGANAQASRGNWVRAVGPGVSFAAVPYYQGPLEYLLKWPRMRRIVKEAVPTTGAVILRVQSQIGSTMEPVLRSSGHPFGVEVTGDPWDELAPGSVKHPLRFVFRTLFTRQVKRQCRSACAVAYVTREALQRRYPASLDAFTTHYSSVELPGQWFVQKFRPARKQGPIRILSVGTMEQLYKGQDVLIDAFADCIKQGLNAVSYTHLDVYKRQVILTPHLSGSTLDAQEKTALEISRHVRNVLNGEIPGNAINLPLFNQEMIDMSYPFYELCNNLGSIFAQFFEKELESVEIIYNGRVAQLKTEFLTTVILSKILEIRCV